MRLAFSQLKRLEVAICYDHILTLDREIRYIWKGRFSISIFLFYNMRYCALLGAAQIFWNAIVSTTTVRAPSSVSWASRGCTPYLTVVASNTRRIVVFGSYRSPSAHLWAS